MTSESPEMVQLSTGFRIRTRHLPLSRGLGPVQNEPTHAPALAPTRPPRGGQPRPRGRHLRGVLPVFDEGVLAHASPARVAFMLDALASLRADYRERGGDLLLRGGDPAELLPGLVSQTAAEGVTWNADYAGLARERDERVSAALDDTEAPDGPETCHDAICHEPDSITTDDGEPLECDRVRTKFGMGVSPPTSYERLVVTMNGCELVRATREDTTADLYPLPNPLNATAER